MFANHKSLSLIQVPYIPLRINEADYKGWAVSAAYSARGREVGKSYADPQNNAAGIVILNKANNEVAFSEGSLSGGQDDKHSELLLLARFLLEKVGIQRDLSQTNYEYIFSNIRSLLDYKIILFTERTPCNIKRGENNPQTTCEALLREIAYSDVSIEVYFSMPNSYLSLVNRTLGILLGLVDLGLYFYDGFPSIVRRCIFSSESNDEYIRNNVEKIQRVAPPALEESSVAAQPSHANPPQMLYLKKARESDNQPMSVTGSNTILENIKTQVTKLSGLEMEQLMLWVKMIKQEKELWVQEEEEGLSSSFKLQND